jgi:starch phosphorylase
VPARPEAPVASTDVPDVPSVLSVDPPRAAIAYYSMEVALSDDLPTFSGGLGVLAGDHLRAAADRGLPMVGVTLLYNHGFFRQSVVGGIQREQPVAWSPAAHLEEIPIRVPVAVCGRPVVLRTWRAVVDGVGGRRVPVLLLDTDLEENAPEDRLITDRLYPSDPYDRLRQEAVLGLGGPRVLEAVGYQSIRLHHLNEGHGALVPVGLLARRLAAADPAGMVGWGLAGAARSEVEAVRRQCVFTTHTPVPAGHDRFAPEVARAVLGDALVDALGALDCLERDGSLNMTVLGMRCAGFVNGVSLRHRDVSRAMFPGEDIRAITNGVHTATWAGPSMAAVFDRHLPGWRRDSQQLRYAVTIPLDELRAAHAESKRMLCTEVRRRAGVAMLPGVLTIGVARRFAAYKRNDLVLSDLDRLAAAADIGPIQVVLSGKAHPGDPDGRAMIERVVRATGRPRHGVTVAFLEDYGLRLARLLCAGSDVWLNTPTPPNEASGTSGMKAAVNGVPSLSTLDGWWVEGFVDGVTGWAIDTAGDGHDADRLYDLLEETVVPTYYKDRDALVAMGRHAISLNGSFFSAHRMVDEYARRAYALHQEAVPPGAGAAEAVPPGAGAAPPGPA